jgi:anti-anti-sigma factor
MIGSANAATSSEEVPMPSHQTHTNGQLPEPTLRIHTDGVVVRVAGEIDEATACQFGAALADCDRKAARELDLSGVTFFSAAGVRSLAANGWTTGGHPHVIASAAVRRVLAICDLESLVAGHGAGGCSDCSPSMV